MSLDYEQINYEQIKQLARQTGQRVTDLIPLAPQNDPFYTGTPNDWALAEWFAALWQAFRYTNKVHIRRVHYQIVSQNPPISATFIDRVLSAYGSPAAGTGQALYDLGVESGIDPVYALAFFLHEDSFSETGIGAVNHSLGNIRCSAGYRCQSGFRYYATWQDAYQDWYSLLLNGYVKGQITNSIVGHPCTTVDEIVPVYAPSSDHNNVAAYIAAIKHAVERWRNGQVWI
jgi:hypothetical protein